MLPSPETRSPAPIPDHEQPGATGFQASRSAGRHDHQLCFPRPLRICTLTAVCALRGLVLPAAVEDLGCRAGRVGPVRSPIRSRVRRALPGVIAVARGRLGVLGGS